MGKSKPPPSSSPAAVGRWATPLAVCVLTALAYGPTHHAPLVYDDIPNIEQNFAIRIQRLSPRELWRVATDAKLRRRPVANLSFALNYWWGELNVTGYHLTNVAIHLAASCAVYLLILTTLRLADFGRNDFATRSPDDRQRFGAAVAMAVFALHPLQTQSVSYVVQRMNSLAALFYVLALIGWLHGRLSVSWRRRAVCWSLAVGCWLAAVGSKENAATLPLAIGLYEALLLRPGSAARLKRSQILALVAGAAAVLAIGFRTLIASGELQGYENRGFTLEQRLLTQSRVVWSYAGLTILPLPSHMNLLHDVTTSNGLWSPRTTALALAAGAVYLAVGVAIARQWSVLALSLLWAPLHLAIESSVLPLEMMYEHRMYLPLFGPALAAAWVWGRWGPSRGAVRWSVPVAVALLLAALTHARNQTWRDPLSLWNDVLAKSPQSARALANRGGVYTAAADWPAANRDLDRALEIEPGLVFARIARGAARHLQGLHQAAADDLWLAVETAPNEEVRAMALRNHGAVMTALGRYPEALDDFSRALRIWPAEVESQFNRGNLYRLQGEFRLAHEDYAACVARMPTHAEAYNNLAALLAECPDAALRDPPRAIECATIACQLRHWKHAQFLDTLAAAHAAGGDLDEAARRQAQAVAVAAPAEQPALRERLRKYDARKSLGRGAPAP